MRSLVPYAVLMVFAALLELEVVRDTSLSTRDGLVTLAVSCAGLLVAKAIADRTVFRLCDIRPVALWMVVATSVVLAAVAVMPFVVALAASGTGINTAPVPGVLMAAGVRCIAGFPVVAYLVGLRRWYVTERAAAEQALVRAEAARIEAGDAVDVTRALIVEAARREIDSSQREAVGLLETAARSEEAKDITRAAESLRSTARSAVRSTSHELWVDDDGVPSIRWRSIVPASLMLYPLPLLLACISIAGFTLARAAGWTEPRGPIALAVIAVVAVLAAIYLVGRLIIRGAPRLAILVTALAVLGGPVAAQMVAGAIIGRGPSVIALAPFAVLVAALTVASSIVLMLRDSGAAVIRAMVDDRARADAQQAALEMMNARLSRDLAAHLHGTVQPQLVAASVALDAAVEDGDPLAVAQAVAQAEAALGVGIEPPAVRSARPARQLAADISARWDALVDITISVDAPPQAPAPPEQVAHVLDECLNNAVIHGHALRADVRIAYNGEGWRIEVADDGDGPAGGAPGLGSSVLDEATGGGWSLEPGLDGGAVVTAYVPDPAGP